MNEKFKIEGNVLCEYRGNNKDGISKIIIPDGITKIRVYAFNSKRKLTEMIRFGLHVRKQRGSVI